MTKEEQFVNELIGYIFAYPDDDYMTMECLCRKLHKHGLVDKKDGFYLAAGDALRKDEPQTCSVSGRPYSECADCEHFKCTADEPQTNTEIAKAIVHKMIDDAVIAEDAYPDLRQKLHDAVDEYEPQMDGYMTTEQTADYRKMLDNAENKVYGNIFEDEPQTEDEILREQCRAFMDIVEQTEREGE